MYTPTSEISDQSSMESQKDLKIICKVISLGKTFEENLSRLSPAPVKSKHFVWILREFVLLYADNIGYNSSGIALKAAYSTSFPCFRLDSKH